MLRIITIISCLFALAVAACVIYCSKGGYYLIWNDPLTKSKLESLIKNVPKSIEEVSFISGEPTVLVKLKDEKECFLILTPEDKSKLLPKLIAKDITLKAICVGRESFWFPTANGQFTIEPYLDWLSEVWLQFFPGGGSNKNHAG